MHPREQKKYVLPLYSDLNGFVVVSTCMPHAGSVAVDAPEFISIRTRIAS